MNRFSLKITKKNVLFFMFTLYAICFTSYQLNQGFDDYVVKIVPIVFILLTIAFNFRHIKFTKLLIWFLLFWGYYIVSRFWASNDAYLDLLLPNILYLFPPIFCLPYMIETKEDFNLVFKCIIISFFYSIVLILIRGGIGQIGTERIGKIIGLSPNAVGMRLAIGSLLCLYLFHNEKKKNGLYIILLFIFMVLALFTGSRKAILMLLLGITSYEILLSKGIKFFFKSFLMLFGAVCVLYLVFHNQYLYNVLGYRIDLMFQQLGSNQKIDGSVYERQFYIEQAKILFFSHPVLGAGGNNFAAYMSFINYKHIAYSHNNFTELLSTLGIVGFILYYYMWFKVLYKLFVNFRKKNNILNLLLLIIIGVYIVIDYGNVSYYDVFHIMMLSIAFLYVNLYYKRVNSISEE